MDDKVIKKSKSIYNSIAEYLDEINWEYDRNDNELCIHTGVGSNDLPINFFISVLPKSEIILFYSYFPFKVPQAKYVDVAIAICAINDGLLYGNIDFDMEKGALSFRMTTCFSNSLISKSVFNQMMQIGISTIDDYNDLIFDFVEGKMSLDNLLKAIVCD
ncbi:MAG: YbjN domain-containing protein [Clostridia bacterium]|nr:YbjN domain-containing protein [Clostridia bacterium]